MAEVKEKAKPFFYSAEEPSDSLALLIHGFSGTPYDLREIGEHLARHGISALGVRIAGHGSSPEDLIKTNAGDWWHSVYKELEKSKKQYSKIFLVGYSFGANLAIDFAVRYPDSIKSIILLGPSVFIRRDGFFRLLLPIYRLFFKYQIKTIAPKDVLEYTERGTYTKIPVKSVKDLFDFIDNYTKKEIPLVNVPTLIIQSSRDRVVHPRSAYYVYERIKTEKKELLYLDNHEHNPFFCDQKQEIFDKVADFLKRHS